MKKTLLLLLWLLVVSSPVYSEVDNASVRDKLLSFVNQISSFNHFLPQEKVYLHFDNTAYFLGETIWYNAYVVRADSLLPSPLSRVLHVQLLTQEGTIVDSRKHKIVDGQCHGDFRIGKDYASGYYEVRAYTQYMLNFGNVQKQFQPEINAFFFEKDDTRRFFRENATVFSRVFPVYERPVKDGNYRERTVVSRPKARTKLGSHTPELEITFFPEGGALVAGLQSRVAFEARDGEGRLVEIKGRYYNAKGKLAGAVKTSHRGKGDFFVTPEGKNSGKVIVSYEDKNYSFNLPEARRNGYVMTVIALPGKDVEVEIQSSANQPADTIGLTVICRGQPYVFETLIPENGKGYLKIPLKLLPTGVNQFTLFNAMGEIFAERMLFVNHRDYEKSEIKVDGLQKLYASYVPIRFSLELPHDSVLPQTMSVSVCNKLSREKNASSQSMLTNLLLSSDLYGFIESPDYYFSKPKRRLSYELDLLMLVQGWRRYDWQEMAGVVPFEPEFKMEKGLGIYGTIHPIGGTKWGKAARQRSGLGIAATLFVDTVCLSDNRTADKDGNFSFVFPDFTGNGTLFLKVDDRKRIWGRSESEFLKTNEISHMLMEYIPLKSNYVPLPKNYDYLEFHNTASFWTDTTGLSREEWLSLKQDDEAWLLSLPEAEVKARYDTRYLVGPPTYFDPMDELNFQMDIGMFFGVVAKENIAVNAAVRHAMKEGASLVGGGPSATNDEIEFELWSDRAIEKAYYLGALHIPEPPAGIDSRAQDLPSRLPEGMRIGQNLEYMKRLSLNMGKTSRETYEYQHKGQDYYAYYVSRYQVQKTVQPVYNGRRLTFCGYSEVKEFYSPNYRQLQGEKPRDFRRTLYWNPSAIVKDGKVSVSLYNNGGLHGITISAEGLSPDGQILVLER